MNMSVELIITFISALAAILGIVSYFQKNVVETQEFKSNVINTFKNAKKRTEILLRDLEKYCAENNALNEHMMQGFSYLESIEMLRKALDTLFTEQNLRVLEKINRKTIAVEKVVESIETHEKHIIEIQNYFKKYILKENLNDSIFLH